MHTVAGVNLCDCAIRARQIGAIIISQCIFTAAYGYLSSLEIGQVKRGLRDTLKARLRRGPRKDPRGTPVDKRRV